MHCFIGIDVADPLRGSMLKLKADWQRLGFPPADFHNHTHPHVTIIPPFETNEVAKMVAELSAITAKFPRFDADFAEIGVFNRRILHIVVESNGIIDLAAQFFDYGRGVYNFLEHHPVYHAHTTVGYVQDPLTDTQFNHLKAQLESLLALPHHQQITSIQLFGRERPGTDYRTVANLELAD